MRRTSVIPILVTTAAVALGLVATPMTAQAASPAAATVVAAQAPRMAAPTVTVRPNFTTRPKRPYRANKRITVTFVGMPKNQTIMIAVCRAGTNLARGAVAIGDCAPFAGPSSEFARSNSRGAGRGAVTILRGALKANNWPGWTCGRSARKKCVLIVSDLSGRVIVKKPITYRR